MEVCALKVEKGCKEISSSIDVRYFWGKLIAFGHVTGISKKCMCMKAQYCFPVNSNIELLLPTKHEIITIAATVRRYRQINFRNDIMCVEVLQPSRKFSDYIDSLSPSTSVSR